MKKSFKTMVALVLSLMLLLTAMPFAVFAGEADKAAGATETGAVSALTKDYYLVGTINGSNVGFDADWQSPTDYKFNKTTGKVSITVTKKSYVFVKTSDNSNWFMTDGWLGETVTSATLYNSSNLGTSANKLYLPVGKLELTLNENKNGTLTLSYTSESQQGTTAPGTSPATVPSTSPATSVLSNDYYLVGTFDGVDYGCEKDYATLGDYKFNRTTGKVQITFTKASYAMVKTGDNKKWYMTDGWQGKVESAVLYDSANLGENADKLYAPAGKIEYTLSENNDGTLTLSYEVLEWGATEPDTTIDPQPGSEPDTTTGTEPDATTETEPYSSPEPGNLSKDYYLVGNFDGEDYGCGDDYATLGDYKFDKKTGKVSAEFAKTSYAMVKTGDNKTWYMTDGWLGKVDHAVLIDSSKLDGENPNLNLRPNKLYVPAGKIEFSLAENEDGSLTLSYVVVEAAPTEPDTTAGTEPDTTVGTEPDTTTETEPYSAPEPGNLSKDYYLVGTFDGVNYGCEKDAENLGDYKFDKTTGKVTAEFKKTSYAMVKTGDNKTWYMTDGWQGKVNHAVLYDSENLGENANKLYVPAGKIEFSLAENKDGSLTLSYVVIEAAPTDPPTEPDTTPLEGELSQDYYLVGYFDGADYGCEKDAENLGDYKFDKTTGKVTATFKKTSYAMVKTADNEKWFMTNGWLGKVDHAVLYDSTILDGENENESLRPNKLYVPAGKVEFTLAENKDGSLTLSYEVVEAAPTEPPTEPDTTPLEGELTQDYYLVGYFDGADYGCEKDAENLGDYKFDKTTGKVTATFKKASYAMVKTADNEKWYMTDGWLGKVDNAILYDSTILDGENENEQLRPNKLYVPAGKVEFTLVENKDSSLRLSYVVVEAPPTEPPTEPDTTPLEGELTQDYYLVGYFDGANYGCEEDSKNLGDYKFDKTTGKVTATFKKASYAMVKTADNEKWYMTNGWLGKVDNGILYNSESLGEDANKLYVPAGKVEFTLTEFKDGSLGLTYVVVEAPPTEPPTEPDTTPAGGELSQDYYLIGYFNGADYGDGDDYANMGDYKFDRKTGKVTVTFDETSYACVKEGTNKTWYMTNGWQGFVDSAILYDAAILDGDNPDESLRPNKLYVPAGTVEFTLVEYKNGTLGLSYEVLDGPTPGEDVLSKDYYLIGYFDGADYGDGDDYKNMGDYKFDRKTGKVTATFTLDSYACVKEGTNTTWYMTDGWQGMVNSAVLYDSKTLDGENPDESLRPNKLYAPAGTIEFTLVENADGSLTLSYELPQEPTYEPVTEPATEPVTEPVTEKPTEQPTEQPTTEKPTEKPTEPNTEPTQPTTEEPDPTDVLIGDVDGDGIITISDATEIQKILASFYTPTKRQRLAADTNGDGEITIQDATNIQKYLARMIDKLGK